MIIGLDFGVNERYLLIEGKSLSAAVFVLSSFCYCCDQEKNFSDVSLLPHLSDHAAWIRSDGKWHVSISVIVSDAK